MEDKRLLAEGINRTLEPLRERRRELADKPEYVDEVLRDGARRAQAIARETLGEVREKMESRRRRSEYTLTERSARVPKRSGRVAGGLKGGGGGRRDAA